MFCQTLLILSALCQAAVPDVAGPESKGAGWQGGVRHGGNWPGLGDLGIRPFDYRHAGDRVGLDSDPGRRRIGYGGNDRSHGSAYYGRNYGAPYHGGGYYDGGVYYRERRER